MHKDDNLTGQQQFNQIYERLERLANRKKDDIATLHEVNFLSEGNNFKIGNRLFETTEHSLGQLATTCGISKDYINSLSKKGFHDLVEHNFNYLIPKVENKSFMFRSIEEEDSNYLYAMMSDKYKVIDNIPILDCVGRVINEMDDFKNDFKIDIQSTPRKSLEYMSINFTQRNAIQVGTLPNGKPDLHRIGFKISNSEAGKSSLRIEFYCYRLVCSNGLMRFVSEGSFRQIHKSSYDTKELMRKVRNGIYQVLKQSEDTIAKLEATQHKEVENVDKFIKEFATKHKLTNDFTNRVIANYKIEPYGNVFSVIQAITHSAKSIEDELARDRMLQIAGALLVA